MGGQAGIQRGTNLDFNALGERFFPEDSLVHFLGEFGRGELVRYSDNGSGDGMDRQDVAGGVLEG